jgi:hypothetical protein
VKSGPVPDWDLREPQLSLLRDLYRCCPLPEPWALLEQAVCQAAIRKLCYNG